MRSVKLLTIVLSVLVVSSIAVIVPIIIIQYNRHSNPYFNWNFPLNATTNSKYAIVPYMIPMRDGAHLATDVYCPLNISSPLPVILVRTPYDKNQLSTLSSYTEDNYIVVIQDVRGYYHSEGKKGLPFFSDRDDGQQTIKWIESQPWSNKKIVSWGPSALGIVQYLMAPKAPSSLKGQFIMVATPDVYEAAFTGGSLRKELIFPWMESQGYSEKEIASFFELEKLNGTWDIARINKEFTDVHVPAIHLGGWYDIFTKGTVEGFEGYQYKGGEGAKGNSKLVMGPWVHTGAFGYPSGKYKGIDYVYPNQDLGLIFKLNEAIFSKWLKDNSTLWDQMPTVMFYLMSSLPYNPDKLANNWYAANQWPLNTINKEWYMLKEGQLSLEKDESPNNFLSYLYNPNDPVPTFGGGNLALEAGAYDQQGVENRTDVLVFTTDVLDEPMTIIGQTNVSLQISSNCTDTDFTVKLTDVFPDNTSMLITDTIIRARNRNSLSSWDFLTPGKKYYVNISLDPTAYVFNKGHKIRIDISSSNYPRFETNPNTGDPVWRNSTTFIANNTLFLNGSKVSMPTYDYSKLRPFSFQNFSTSLAFQPSNIELRHCINNFHLSEKMQKISYIVSNRSIREQTVKLPFTKIIVKIKVISLIKIKSRM